MPNIDFDLTEEPVGPTWHPAQILQFLQSRLRIRVEQGRNRLDMRRVIHLEMLIPNTHGDSKWTAISTDDLEV